MDQNNSIQMMRRCIAEIKTLRRINNELAPKAEAFDAIQKVLNFLPGPGITASEDLVWVLERQIDELNEEQLKKQDSE